MIRAAPHLALVALLAAAAPALGDDVAEAKVHLRKGTEHYGAGRWREAIAEFEAAYRLKPHGAIHFNVARCREKLAEWPGALRAYQDYLREVPDARDRAAVRSSIRRLEERLAAAGVQALLVYTDPPGAEVRLDGRTRGATPFHIVLPPGAYALALALDGYARVAEDVALAADTSRVVDVVLRPAAPPPRASATAPAPGRRPDGSAGRAAGAPVPGSAAGPDAKQADLSVRPPAAAPLVPAAPAAPREKRRLYTWIAAGTAVAAVAAGAYFGAAAQRDADAVDGIANDGALADRKARDAESKARTANVLYAVAGGAAAAGVTLFFVEKKF